MMKKQFYVPGVETHSIESRYIDQTYRIQVMQPLMRKGSTERFPALYLTDGNEHFDAAKGIAHELQVTGQVRRFVLVGIGYPSENPFGGDILRGRDLTPARRPAIPGLPRCSPIEDVPGIEEGERNWNGADYFLQFIRHELIPLVESRYPVLPGIRAYFGHSLGGGFGLHALFSQPGLFNRLVISSPGVLWEGDPHGIEPAKNFIASRRRLDAKVFMSVGSEEEFQPGYERSQFCSGFYRLAALLRQSKIPGFELTSRLYSGETHASVWLFAFTHGVQAVLGPADAPPMSEEEPERTREVLLPQDATIK